MVAAGGRRPLVLSCLALAVVTGLVYMQVAGFEFLRYDDDKFLVDNPAIQQGLTGEAIVWAFTNNHASLWLPATWISHTLDFTVFGQDPAGHHLSARKAIFQGFVPQDLLQPRRTGQKNLESIAHWALIA